MARRIDPAWLVAESVENAGGDRCVDLFRRGDGSWGFEEFRRDPEDRGTWTPVAYHAAIGHPTRDAAWRAALGAVPWLTLDR